MENCYPQKSNRCVRLNIANVQECATLSHHAMSHCTAHSTTCSVAPARRIVELLASGLISADTWRRYLDSARVSHKSVV